MIARFRHSLLAACLLGMLGVGAQAQQAAAPSKGGAPAALAASPDAATSLATALRASTRNDPANHVPAVPLLREFLVGTHTGPADEAVVGVEVINQAKGGATETRRCSGLLIRCDGFFLLPPAFTSLAMSGGAEAVKQTVRITLNPGTPKERRSFAYIRHYIVDGIDMTVMKAQDVHAPSARPLMPTGLKPGDEVELAWTDWDAAAGKFSPVKRRKTRLGTQPSEAEQKKLAWQLGEIPLEETQEGVQSGAAVIGPDGMAVGLLPGSAKRHDRFTSFSVLDRVTNCVVAAPTTDEEFARLQKLEKDAANPAADAQQEADPAQTVGAKAEHPVNDMVEIPGGPVRLPALFLQDQRDMCAETIACMPAFKIDRYKVSNREYYEFWRSIPEKERAKREVRAVLYPISWADTDPPFPAEVDDVPVLGVPVSGARAYAQSKGKRLPTSYEWSRAAFGLFGDAALPAWMGEYMRDRQQTWARIEAAHDRYVAGMIPGLRQRQAASDFDRLAARLDRRPLPAQSAPEIHLPRTIPFFDVDDEFIEACLWSQRLVQDEVKRLCEKWQNPLYILPSGSRPFDTSPFGLMDVILNGNERVVYSPEPLPGVDPPVGGRPQTVGLVMSTVDGKDIKPTQMSLYPLEVPAAVRHIEGGTYTTPMLLSRRLVSASSQARPEVREFSPSDAQSYAEYRSRITETMTMALPIVRTRIHSIRDDTFASDLWGEGAVTVKAVERKASGIGIYVGPVFGELVTMHSFRAERACPEPLPVIDGFKLLDKRISRGSPLIAEEATRFQPEKWGNRNIHIPIHMPGRIQLSDSPVLPVRPDETVGLFLGVYFDETFFYSLWEGPSPFQQREMGRDPAKDPPAHIGLWPVLGAPLTQLPDIYLVPNGFRCAR
jgi:hypothetical protein